MAERLPGRTIRLRDTRSGELHEVPHAGDAVSLYVCGVTPYDTTHLGHAFTYVQFDTLVRTLRWLGREVVYVQNVTDVDESILRRARELGVHWRTLGDQAFARYAEDMRWLGVSDPTRMVRATEVVPAIVAVTEALVAKGAAYVADGGSVFFRLASRDGFGEVSGLDREAMLRVAAEQDDADVDDPRKEDPLDVALWRGWSGDADEPRWDSPWGAGRPGWHVECAVIAARHLGHRVDLHGGGEDLRFPHHEAETAIVEATTGVRPFVRTWLHVALVTQGGRKMAKSDGNLVFVGDLAARVGDDALRLYLLSHHYRAGFEFDAQALAAAAERADRLRARLVEPDREGGRARDEFVEALTDDLDTPRALEALDGAAGRTARELAGVLGLHPEARLGEPAPDALAPPG